MTFSYSIDNNGCSDSDQFIPPVMSYQDPAFAVTFNSGQVTDRPLNRLWFCAQGQSWDGAPGAYDVSNGQGFGVDNTAPSGFVTIERLPGELASGPRYTVSWSASDATSGIPFGGVTLYELSQTGGNDIARCSGGATGSCTITKLVPGNYCYYVRMQDAAGNLEFSNLECTTVL